MFALELIVVIMGFLMRMGLDIRIFLVEVVAFEYLEDTVGGMKNDTRY